MQAGCTATMCEKHDYFGTGNGLPAVLNRVVVKWSIERGAAVPAVREDEVLEVPEMGSSIVDDPELRHGNFLTKDR